MNHADTLGLMTLEWPKTPVAGYGDPASIMSAPVCEIELHRRVTMAARLAMIEPSGDLQLISAKAGSSAAQAPTRINAKAALRVTPLAEIQPVQDAPEAAKALPQPSMMRVAWSDKRYRDVMAVAWLERKEGCYTYEIGHMGGLTMHYWPQATISPIQSDGRPQSSTPEQWKATQPDAVQVAANPDEEDQGSDNAGDAMLAAAAAALDAEGTRKHVCRTLAELVTALDEQQTQQSLRIGAVLVGMGFVKEQDVEDAIEHQRQYNQPQPLGETLVAMGRLQRDQLVAGLAYKQGHPYIDVRRVRPQDGAIRKLTINLARRRLALPLMSHRKRLVIAVPDPTSNQLADELKFATDGRVVLVGAAKEALVPAIEMAYTGAAAAGASSYATGEHAEGMRNMLAELSNDVQEADETVDVAATGGSDDPMVKLLNGMILQAREAGASDIHIECPPSPHDVQIRFRRDGVLHPFLKMPNRHQATIVARLKVMCDLDISEKRKPQDGKIKFERFVPGEKLELRVATIPTVNGHEDVVLRLLASAKALPLDKLAFETDVLDRLRSAIDRPYGMVLCVGPTGSGKTTTLHAALGHLNRPDRKVWTAEDPVEITQPGLRQVQVNPKIDWTFAKALRAFLRADPDVIMVGEIRDAETAQMAVEASLTGHLVLSTLHTNSASETITRLLDMGMDPFSFADSLLAVLAQRLVRKLCSTCRKSEPAPDHYVRKLAAEYAAAQPSGMPELDVDELCQKWGKTHGTNGSVMRYHSSGCAHCGNTGLSGRVGLHELLMVDADLRSAIQTRKTAADIKLASMQRGMRTLRQDGILKVLAGLTTIDEVRAMSNE